MHITISTIQPMLNRWVDPLGVDDCSLGIATVTNHLHLGRPLRQHSLVSISRIYLLLFGLLSPKNDHDFHNLP